MKASDWWTEFQVGVEWAKAERKSPVGAFVGNAFTAMAEPVVQKLGAIAAYRAINQGQRIASGATVIQQGRNLDLTSLRSGHPSQAF